MGAFRGPGVRPVGGVGAESLGGWAARGAPLVQAAVDQQGAWKPKWGLWPCLHGSEHQNQLFCVCVGLSACVSVSCVSVSVAGCPPGGGQADQGQEMERQRGRQRSAEAWAHAGPGPAGWRRRSRPRRRGGGVRGTHHCQPGRRRLAPLEQELGQGRSLRHLAPHQPGPHHHGAPRLPDVQVGAASVPHPAPPALALGWHPRPDSTPRPSVFCPPPRDPVLPAPAASGPWAVWPWGAASGPLAVVLAWVGLRGSGRQAPLGSPDPGFPQRGPPGDRKCPLHLHHCPEGRWQGQLHAHPRGHQRRRGAAVRGVGQMRGGCGGLPGRRAARSPEKDPRPGSPPRGAESRAHGSLHVAPQARIQGSPEEMP